MPFIPENELEQALVAAVKNPATVADFYRLLLERELLVLGTAEGEENASEKFTLTPGGKLNLVTGVKNGGRFIPGFSSRTRMQDYIKQESKYLSINGRALLELTRGAQVTLNPASEYGKEFPASQVAQLLIVGKADHPAALVDALTAVFAARPDIEAAWMIQVTFADREPHPLVGIEMDAKNGGDWPSLLQAIEAAASQFAAGIVFDVQRVNRQARAGVTDALLQTAPFYRRRTPGSPTLN